MIDIKKAHLHAPIEGSVYEDLPPERQKSGRCAKLKYGMRQAARNWEKEYSKTLTDAGFVVGSKEAIILNRCVRWRDDGVVFEADRAHVEKVLEATRMADCKANTVLATKEEHPDVDEPLEGEQCKACRSAVARANYLSQDRPDIRFTRMG